MSLAKLKSLLTVLELKGAFRAIITWPKFSLASFLILSRLKQAGVNPLTIIDLGANVGQFAVAATKFFDKAQIFSFEPDPQTAEILRQNLKGINQATVIVSAVGDCVGDAEFFVNKDAQVSSILKLGNDRKHDFPDSTVIDKITVPVTTLDAFFHEMPLERPILVKIDVQGFEDRVIMGAKTFLRQTEWVLMEVSFADLYEGERDFRSLLELMDKHGFRFLRPVNYHISPLTNQIIEMDALFQRKPI